MKHRSFFSLLLTLILFSCKSYQPAAFPGEAFEEYQIAEEAGFDTQKLKDLDVFIKKNARTTGLIALYKGKVIYKYGDIEKISYIASCRKSVLSMLYGKLVAEGTVDLNQSIGALGIDERDGLLPKEKEATVDHILTARSGVFHKASNGGYDKKSFLKRGSVEPGTYFVYNNWDFNVAGHILELYAKRSIYEELEDQFARPLGFQDWNIQNQKKSGNKSKSQYPAYHIYLSTRDMAKLGQLMLNEGNWKGQQLIPQDWVKKTTTTVTPHETMIDRYGPADPKGIHNSYGYMWWLIDNYQGKEAFKGGFNATGYGGQFITILPEVDMVIAHKTKLGLLTMAGIAYKGTSDNVYFEMIDRIIQARKK